VTVETKTHYPVEAVGDLKKVTTYTALHYRQYLSSDFDIKGPITHKIYRRGCGENHHLLFIGKSYLENDEENSL
jgi:hypothetical protein